MPRATPLPPDERRAAIIAVTAPLLRERGREVSTREIAEAAGIAEGTIFRVFTSKDELIDAVLDDAFDPSASYRALLEIDPATDLAHRVTNAVAILQRRLDKVFGLISAIGFRPPTGDSAADPPTRPAPEHRTLDVAALAAVLTPDAARLKVSPERAATTLNALVLAMSHPLLRGHCVEVPRPDPQEITDLFLHGIVAHTGCPPHEGA